LPPRVNFSAKFLILAKAPHLLVAAANLPRKYPPALPGDIYWIERIPGHRSVLRSPGFPVQRIALDVADQLVNLQRIRCRAGSG
jgi:hypothetical protein